LTKKDNNTYNWQGMYVDLKNTLFAGQWKLKAKCTSVQSLRFSFSKI